MTEAVEHQDVTSTLADETKPLVELSLLEMTIVGGGTGTFDSSL